MYAKVNEYKDILKSNEQEYDVYLILQDGTKVDADISGFRLIYTLGEKIIGNFVSRRVEFNLFNTSLYNITNKEFEVFVGLKDNNAFNYISLGKFIANKPETKDEKTDECSIIANDYSLKFKTPYEPVITFPCTVSNAIKQICEHLNIEYIANDFINANFLLREFFIAEDANFFQVIKGLSEAGFANAHIVNSNSLIVKSPSKSKAYTFDLNEIFELKKEDNNFGPLNAVVASRVVADDGSTTEDVYARNEESISKNGIYEYKVIQNDAIDYDRQTAVNNMLAGILDFEYVPATIETVYNPATEVGDLLEVPDAKTDTSFLLYAKEITADLASGLMTIESTEKTKTETDYTAATVKDKRQKTEYKVNKMEGKITQLISKTDTQSERITSITADLNGVETRVSSTETKIENAESAIEETQADVQELDAKVDDEVSNLQSQIDGTIQFWNGSEIPTLNNEPASLWTTEEDKNNHRADLYTVIEDVDGELKQGKSYRFDKVGTTWTWIELKDNELSAVQALAASKAKVFVTTPKVPYNVGDLWLRNKELYECQTAKDASGTYSETDWVKATKYTDDTAAALAQMTADQAIQNTTLTATTEEAKEFHIENSADSYCKSIEIYGESTQETRSGKNLFNYDTVSYYSTIEKVSVNGEDCYKSKNLTNGIWATIYTNQSNMEVGKKYTMSFDIWADIETTFDRNTFYVNSNTSTTHNLSKITTSRQKLVSTFTYGENGGLGILHIYPHYVSGNNIYIGNVQIEEGESASEYEPYGQMPSPEFPSEIKSVSGKNELDVSNVNNTSLGLIWTNNNNKIILSGTATSNYSQTSRIKKNLPKGTYVFSHTNKNSNLKFNIWLYNSNGDLIGNTKLNNPVTTTEEVVGWVLYVEGVVSGTAYNETIEVQLAKGSIATYYVPYNHIGFKSIGKNWLNKEEITQGTLNDGSKSTGYTPLTITDTGISTTVANNYAYGVFVGQIQINDLVIGEEYKILGIADEKFHQIYIYTDKLWGNNIISGDVRVGVSFIAPTTSVIIGFYATANIKGETKKISDIRLIKVTEELNDNYEPYKESIITIPLTEPLRSLPNVIADKIYAKVGKIKKELNLGLVVLNGTQVSYIDTAGDDFTTIAIATGIAGQFKSAIYLSNYFVYGSTGNNRLVLNLNSRVIYLKLDNAVSGVVASDTNEQRLEKIKSWLSNNNVEVIYELAEPIVTEITDPAMIEALEHIRTFAGITNITSDASAKLTYYTNTALNDEYETKLNANKQYTQTVEKFAEQEITNESIINSVSEVKTTIQNDYMSKEEASTQYTQLSKKFEFDVNTAIADLKNNGVSKVVSSIITIDENGLTSGRSDSEYYNVMNNTGNYQYNAGQLLAKYDKDGAEIPRLKSDIGVIAGVKHVKENVAGVIHHKTYVIE